MDQTSESTRALVGIVAELLDASDGTVATLESRTGGGLYQALSEHPGARRWHARGLVVGGPELEDGDEDLIDSVRGLGDELPTGSDRRVAEVVALVMALRAREECEARYSVVVTEDPVGMVCIAVAGPRTHIVNAHRIENERNRELVLRFTIKRALVELGRLIDQDLPRKD